ncbi:MAG: hypothetical protein NTV39_04520 [Candidatus Saccharibacteria bacterium]|nr:hypothetical protein [Candidatus Saccharibacteria bacterium]
MEYFLIKQGTGEYIAYRGVNLADMSQINHLTDAIVSAVIDVIEDAPWLSISREDVIDDQTLSGYGARIYVNHHAYDRASRRFQKLVRFARIPSWVLTRQAFRDSPYKLLL